MDRGCRTIAARAGSSSGCCVSLEFTWTRKFDLERDGLRWRLNPADFVHADVFWLGRKDDYDVAHLEGILQPGEVFFDIGANFGYYALTLGSRLNQQCEIHAFEPNPPTLARLRHHVAINGLQKVVHVHDVALSDQAGTAVATKEGNSGGANIVDSDAKSTQVQLTTLDAFCDEQQLRRLDAVKIDVEGFEERVFTGWPTDPQALAAGAAHGT